MGSYTMAFCKCGFTSKELRIGGGRINFASNSCFPSVCLDCEEIFDLNYKIGEYKIDLNELALKGTLTRTKIPLNEREYKCEECNGSNVIIYNDNRLVGKLGDRKIVSWEGYFLTNGTYYCPKCQQMELKFLGNISFFD